MQSLLLLFFPLSAFNEELFQWAESAFPEALVPQRKKNKKATKKRQFLSHKHLPFDQILYELYLAFEFLLYETLFKDVYFRNFCGTLWFFFMI